MIIGKQLQLGVLILNINNQQLYGIKYSYLIQKICILLYSFKNYRIQIIFKTISLTQLMGSYQVHYHLDQSRPGSNDNKVVLHTLSELQNWSLTIKSLMSDTFFWGSFLLKIHYHHHHVAPSAWISLTLSHHPSLSSIASGRSSGLHPILAESCCM